MLKTATGSAPKKIFFLSDHTEAELVFKLGKVKDKDEVFWYRYTKSICSQGKEFPMSLKQIIKLESMKLLITEN